MNKNRVLSIQKDMDIKFMSEAVSLAYRAKGNTSPNPLVGAVITRNNKIIGRGYHSGFGKPHAEIEAINSVRGSLKGATFYITLEPCNTQGKTPPCVETILKLPFKRIVIGMKDPNPAVNGRSVRILREAGYEVDVNVLKKEVEALNPYYASFIKTGKTHFIMKMAVSVDGFIAPDKAGKHYITSIESRAVVHEERFKCDAILIGSNTVNNDNPVLDTSLFRVNIKPVLIILDFSNRLDYSKAVLKDRNRKKIILAGNAHRHALKKRPDIEYVFVESKADSWKAVMTFIKDKRIASVFIEGGAAVFADAVKNHAVSEMMIFTAPILMGSGVRGFNNIETALKLELASLYKTGPDIYARYRCLQE